MYLQFFIFEIPLPGSDPSL